MGEFTTALDHAMAGVVGYIQNAVTQKRSTIQGGVVALFVGFVFFAPELFSPLVLKFCQFLSLAGVVHVGASAADKPKA